MSNVKNSIKEQLILHEDLRLKPYECTEGYITIGVGRNLEAKGISEELALKWLDEDVEDVIGQLKKYKWFSKLDPVRKKVIIDMGFNLGVPGLLEFKKMIQAIRDNDFERAAAEMKDSKWHEQVNDRALRLEEMMRTGEDYES